VRSFLDRREAGRLLGDALVERVGEGDAVVLGIPRGGVVVAAEAAERLHVPLDVVIPRKVGAPGNPELGLGAVAPGVSVLDQRLIRDLRVSDDYLSREIATQEREIERRSRAYRGDRPQLDVAGKLAIVVDDGVATGGTAVAAVRWARRAGAARVILAVPVAPAQAVPSLASEVDELVILATPEPFFAVGQWYQRFDQVEDGEVVRLLSRTSA
jgi:putative phosphoribosyl transferase